jgi:hypothetical protein
MAWAELCRPRERQYRHADPMPTNFANTYGVELLCDRAPVIAKAALLQHLQKRCPGAEPLDRDPESSSLSFVHPQHPIQLSDARLAAQTLVAVADKPLTAETLAAALEQTWDFESAREAIAGCTSSVLVTDFMSRSLEYRERLDLFQRSLRAVIDTVPCSAIHWRPSGRIVDPRAWSESFDRSDPAQLLMAGAVNVRLFNIRGPEDKASGEMVMDTLGLGALGLADLQCHFKDLDPGAVARVLYNLAGYVFLEGDVIADGHTVQGVGDGSKWRCLHEDALVGPERVVLDLNPGEPYAAGNRAV